MERCGIDYLAFSAHKVYAPFGTGVLVVRKGLLHFNNAELETIQSSGEENAGGIAALGKALLILQRIGFGVIQEEEQLLTAMALKGMSQIQGIRIYGIRDPGSPRFACKGGVIAFSFGNIFPDKVASELALAGIGVRYGCHCAHLLIKRLLHIPSLIERFQRLLLTLFPGISLPGVVRVSLGIGNTEADIETLVHALGNVTRQRKFPIIRDSSSGHDGLVTTKKKVQKQIRDFTRNAVQKVYARL
jgi:selenocysteine lyase/cysteine desulfurase